MKDRFCDGDAFIYDRVRYRVRAGVYCDDDMIIDFSFDGKTWHTPSIGHSLILVAFKFAVEENNYGKRGKIKSGRGVGLLLDAQKGVGWSNPGRKVAEGLEPRNFRPANREEL